MPMISSPPSPIPIWNQFSDDWLSPIFDFATEHLHDGGAFFVMHPLNRGHKANVLACCESYGFKVVQSWFGMNRLPLVNPTNPTMTVHLILAWHRIIFLLSCFHLFIFHASYFTCIADQAIYNLLTCEEECSWILIPERAFSSCCGCGRG